MHDVLRSTRNWLGSVGCLAACCLALTGCQSVRDRTETLRDSSRDLFTLHKKESLKPGDSAQRMVTVWSESTIYGPNQAPTRGIGGRIFLYNSHHQAVEADGELVVYAYDDGRTEEDVKPDRKYVITSEEFAKHYSPSDLGPSYSVWIPWDAVGSETTAVSLVPIFRQKDGAAIAGDHSRTLLPGKPGPNSELARRRASGSDDSEVQTVSYNTHRDIGVRDGAGHIESGVKTSTIQVPASMRQRLLKAATERDRSLIEKYVQPVADVEDYTKPSAASQKTSSDREVSQPDASPTDLTHEDLSTSDDMPSVEAEPTGRLTATGHPRPAIRRRVGREPFESRVPAWQSARQDRDPHASQLDPSESQSR